MIAFTYEQNQVDYHMIREEVFMKEQGFQNEFDEIDEIAHHICVLVDGKAAGCIRFFSEKEHCYRIGRLAVLQEYRMLHLGSQLVQAAEQAIDQLDEQATIYLDAQCRVVPFYEKQNYVICGKEHLDEHVAHVEMKKIL